MSKEIYKILASKPHNKHHLKRYFTFISNCKISDGEYTEDHHICPKAKDLFPELADEQWNLVTLTARQHIMAHIMLWKAYGGSQALALECMLGQFNAKTNSRLSNRKIPASQEIRYLANARASAAEYRGLAHIGKAPYFTKDGVPQGLLKTDDPRIIQEDLVGSLYGHKMTDESRQRMSDSKIPNRTTELVFLDQSITVKLSDREKIEAYLAQGWNYKLTEDDRRFNIDRRSAAVSESLTGTARYMQADGTYFGRIASDDPRIAELNLRTQVTYGIVESARNANKAASAAIKGSTVYNNGVKEVKSKVHPGDGWVIGCLVRDRGAQKAAASAKISGSEFWTDGINNYRVKPGEQQRGWTKGMKPRVKKN